MKSEYTYGSDNWVQWSLRGLGTLICFWIVVYFQQWVANCIWLVPFLTALHQVSMMLFYCLLLFGDWWLINLLSLSVCCVVNAAGDGFLLDQHAAHVSPTSPDVGDSLQMVLGSQSFRDEIQTMIAQQMKLPAVNVSLPYAARGCHESVITV